MRAITLWQPWAALVAHGIKRIENRPWAPWPAAIESGDQLAIHAGLRDRPGAWDVDALAAELRRLPPGATGVRGAIVAVVTLADVVETGPVSAAAREMADIPGIPDDQQHFAFGPWCWLLRNARPLTRPEPCRGALGLWRVPEDVERAVRAQLGEG